MDIMSKWIYYTTVISFNARKSLWKILGYIKDNMVIFILFYALSIFFLSQLLSMTLSEQAWKGLKGACLMLVSGKWLICGQMAKNISTLGKYDQRKLWKWICINPFDLLYKKKIQQSNLSLNNKNLKWGEISLWNKCFSLIHIGQN